MNGKAKHLLMDSQGGGYFDGEQILFAQMIQVAMHGISHRDIPFPVGFRAFGAQQNTPVLKINILPIQGHQLSNPHTAAEQRLIDGIKQPGWMNKRQLPVFLFDFFPFE